MNVCQSTAFWWVRCWRDEGEAGLSDERHGHLYKMTPEIQDWLKEYCGQALQLSSRQVKELIQEKFKVEISRGYLNRVRAELGVSQLKKAVVSERRWQERAGSLLLAAAAQQTGLLEAIGQSLPAGAAVSRLTKSQPQSRQALLLTLLFLGAVGLERRNP
jgi:transposase